MASGTDMGLIQDFGIERIWYRKGNRRSREVVKISTQAFERRPGRIRRR